MSAGDANCCERQTGFGTTLEGRTDSLFGALLLDVRRQIANCTLLNNGLRGELGDTGGGRSFPGNSESKLTIRQGVVNSLRCPQDGPRRPKSCPSGCDFSQACSKARAYQKQQPEEETSPATKQPFHSGFLLKGNRGLFKQHGGCNTTFSLSLSLSCLRNASRKTRGALRPARDGVQILPENSQ